VIARDANNVDFVWTAIQDHSIIRCCERGDIYDFLLAVIHTFSLQSSRLRYSLTA